MEKVVVEVPKLQIPLVKEESGDGSPQILPLSPQPPLSRESSSERIQLPVTIHSIIAETTNDVSGAKLKEIHAVKYNLILYISCTLFQMPHP